MVVAAEIKPLIGQKCTVKYGKTVTEVGTVLAADARHLELKARYGTYSIPLDLVVSVTALT